MKKFKYLKISKTKKLRYLNNYYKNNLYIIFLPGFQSDILGKKPQTLFKYANKKKNLAYHTKKSICATQKMTSFSFVHCMHDICRFFF